MPLQKIEENGGSRWALWKIEEDEATLAQETIPYEKVPDLLVNGKKRLEWFAGRALVKRLMDHAGIPFKGIVKDPHGKPFPAECSLQLSLSHSFPYVAAYLHTDRSVGIDLEQPKAKLLTIAPRVLDPAELADAGQNITKHCIYWCAKEALIKIYGKKDLILAKNLKISPFSLNSAGEIIGRIVVNSTETIVPLYYEVYPDFTLVLNKP